MAKAKKLKLSRYFYQVIIGLVVFFAGLSACLAVGISPDAIATRVIPNPDHLSPLAWYQANVKNQGSPQVLQVDGYEAIRDGRTVYVNAANISGNNFYTNIYLLSFNQNMERATEDIFSQILAHWKFNTNVPEERKGKVRQDTKRLADLAEIKSALNNYQKTRNGNFPALPAGSYVPGKSLSVWPSWQDALGKELGLTLPLDPVNRLGACPGYDATTCWDEKNQKFAGLPNNSQAYVYTNTGARSYNLCAIMQSGYLTSLAQGACPGSAVGYEIDCDNTDWTPNINPDTVCTNQTIIETNGCGDTRNILHGNKCCDTAWLPNTDPTTICAGQPINQTGNCGNTRVIYGAKTSGACCAPANPDCAAGTCLGQTCNTGCAIINGTRTDGACTAAPTQTVACTIKPANTDWNTGATVLQTWNGSAWLPSNASSYDLTPGICRFKCQAGYNWNGSACVAAGLSCESGATDWQPINSPQVTSIYSIVIEPSNNQIFYATTDSGIYKTINGATTWARLTTTSVRVLAIDPGNSQIRYSTDENPSSGSGDIYKSTDGGATWTSIIDVGLKNSRAWSFIIDPNNSQTLYFGIANVRGTTEGIYKSTNGGGSWTAVNNGLINPTGQAYPSGYVTPNVYSLAIDPSNSQVIYAGTMYGGVFKSTNGGGSWTAVNNGFGSSPTVRTIVIDSSDSQVIYAGTQNNGIYKTTNGGASWTAVNTGFPNSTTNISALIINPSNNQIIYAGTSAGIYKTANAGASWAEFNAGINDGLRPLPPVQSLAIDQADSQAVYAGTTYGIYRMGCAPALSDSVWQPVNSPRVDAIPSVFVDPDDDQILLAATSNGIYKTVNGATTWAKLNNGLFSVAAMAVDPANKQIIYATEDLSGTYSVLKSSNGGAAWAAIETGLTNKRAWALMIDPRNSQTVYLGTFGGVFKTTDGGASWTQINDGLSNPTGQPYPSGALVPGIYSLAIDPLNSQVIYAGTMYGGVFKTTNAGASWTTVNAGLPNFPTIKSLAVDPLNGQVIYASIFSNGIFKSTNGGASWAAINIGLPDSTITINRLTIDPSNSQTVYAATFANGVYRTANAGASWAEFNAGINDGLRVLPNTQIIAVNPSNSQKLYAGTSYGIYRLR